MIDLYFRRPVFWDYFLAFTFSGAITLLWRKKLIVLPKEEHIYSVVSDLATISLTMAGFVLTLLTVLISFKSTTKRSTESITENDTVFEIFFSTALYFDTVKHLKNSIISLTLIAVLGYILKLALNSQTFVILFVYDVIGITVVFLTLWRCLFILSKIIKIQQDN